MAGTGFFQAGLDLSRGWLESEACWEPVRGRHGPLVGCTGLLEPSRGPLQLGAAHSAGASFLEARMESSRLTGASKGG